MTPTTEPAKRIASLFRRKPTTHWTDKEITQYKKLVKAGYFKDMTDLELVERYYVFERRKENNGIHRRDMDTFLNNYPGELDRARMWDAQFRNRQPKPKQRINNQTPVSDDEFKRIGELARQQLEQFRRQLQPSH